ncbi:MAG: DUF3999 family protein [Gammaproteobacteria bacterium]
MRFARTLALCSALGAVAALAAAPTLKDFARGLELETVPDRPVQEFTLPEPVYEGVLRADLGDLRVFNGGGIVVPHALCAGPEAVAETVREQALPVFPLKQARAAPAPDTRVTVQTPGGASVQIAEGRVVAGASPALVPEAKADGFVVDASAVTAPLRALRLAWSTPDGASEAQVRVEASEDLNAWRTVVAGTTLLHVAADGRALDRNHVDLPQDRYRYLRLVRNAGPAVAVSAVTADVVEAGDLAEPQWFAAAPAADGGSEGFVFDAARLAPVQAARVVLATSNMALRIALDSRRAPEQPWQQRWSGDISSVGGGNAAQTPEFATVSDPLWRLRVLRGAETLGGGRPTLRLGYHPARLRFLAQGDGPFVAAYGSARVPPAEVLGCEALLPQVPREQRAALIGAARAVPAPAGAFGGPGVLVPPPPPTPVRQIVLWAVLLLGAVALIAMALALLRRLREGAPPGP